MGIVTTDAPSLITDTLATMPHLSLRFRPSVAPRDVNSLRAVLGLQLAQNVRYVIGVISSALIIAPVCLRYVHLA